MKKITLSDLVNIVEYEKARDGIREDVMAHKARRRIELGPEVSLTFEDRKTMIFQIQEMMRAERMILDSVIQEEIDIYNTLLPDQGELSATLFIEITEESLIREKLHKFLGLTDGDKLWLSAGDEDSFAVFEEGRSEEDKIASVHYVRFPVSASLLTKFSNPGIEAVFHIAQGNYIYSQIVSAELRQSLLRDLEGAKNHTT